MKLAGAIVFAAAMGLSGAAYASNYTVNVTIPAEVGGSDGLIFGDGAAEFSPITLLPGDTFDVDATFSSIVDFGNLADYGNFLDITYINNISNESHVYYARYYNGIRGLYTTPIAPAEPFTTYIDPGKFGVNSYGYKIGGSFGGAPGSSAIINGTSFVIDGCPEPSTWITMIIGLGLTGVALRRRRAANISTALS